MGLALKRAHFPNSFFDFPRATRGSRPPCHPARILSVRPALNSRHRGPLPHEAWCIRGNRCQIFLRPDSLLTEKDLTPITPNTPRFMRQRAAVTGIESRANAQDPGGMAGRRTSCGGKIKKA